MSYLLLLLTLFTIYLRDECKTQTNGYSSAKFKSFNSREEASRYLNQSDVGSGHSYVDSSPRTPSADSGRLRVYTDGACAHNGFNGARGGIGIHFPNNPERDISEPLFGRQTNNRAEIAAATRAIQEAKKMGYRKVEINTDSNFLKQAVEEWVPNWKRNGWKKSDGTAVVNKEDFAQLEDASKDMDVKWVSLDNELLILQLVVI